MAIVTDLIWLQLRTQYSHGYRHDIAIVVDIWSLLQTWYGHCYKHYMAIVTDIVWLLFQIWYYHIMVIVTHMILPLFQTLNGYGYSDIMITVADMVWLLTKTIMDIVFALSQTNHIILKFMKYTSRLLEFSYLT